jgi:Peptidase A4 family
MRSRVLGILFTLAASPVWAQISGAPSLTAAPSVPPREHAPRISRGPAPFQWGSNTRIFESPNWAGYALVGTGFTEARGSWTVPGVNCTAHPNGAASFWVGLDGWDNYTVEQTGTESQCNGENLVSYAWYEFFPKAGVTITSIHVSPGDNMSASVVYDDGQFVVTMTDVTTGESYSTASAVPGARRASAEWIAESNGYAGLPDFDAVRFGDDFTQAAGSDYAADATTSGPIGAFGNQVQVSILASDNIDEAVPSFLSADGTSFTVTYWKP